MTDFLQAYEILLKKTAENLKLDCMIFSSEEFNEAEFKICDYIRKNNITDFSVMSPDSDFLVLSLIMGY